MRATLQRGFSARVIFLSRLSAAITVVLLLATMSACKDDTSDDPGTEQPDGACEHHADCSITEICDDGVCAPVGECDGAGNWASCTKRASRLSEEEGWMYACVEDQCTRMCVSDEDCEGEDSLCSDFGKCIPYTGEMLPYDSGDNTPGELKAGVGATLLDMPVGAEMGGYGSRATPNDGRYAVALSASQGQMDAQYVRAVALDNGHNRLLLMRLPVVFSFSQLKERVARNLQEETGVDWRDELIISATHTHSGPTGFWRFPDETAIDPSTLGAGKFNQHFEDRFVESMTAAALEAIENQRDAKLGWTIVENYDPDDRVAQDRWESTPPFDMRRLLLMRIDDAQTNEPMAALFSYGSHATSNSKDYLTDDVTGGAEHGISAALYEEYGRYIPAMYFSEAGGTMSPAMGGFPYAREYAAHRVPQIVLPAFQNIQTSREIALRSRAYRFNLSRESIGYTGDAFRSTLPGTLGGILHSGALLCTGKDSDDEDFATHMDPDVLDCLGNIRLIVHNYQPTPLTRSQITALEIDGLHAITLPGEPAQEVAWQILREMRDQFELSTENNWIFGYVNDHLLYITPTNLRGAAPDVAGFVLGDGMDNPETYTSLDDYPDFAFSYLQGGYETEMTPWGPMSGDFLADRAVDAFAWLFDEDAVPSEHAPILPTEYTRIETPPFAQDTTPDAEIGDILEDTPSDLERLVPVTFAWLGGDHGAEAPQSPLVTLERENGGQWAAVIGPDGLPVTNRGLTMGTRLKIVDEDTDAPRYHWSVYWQAALDLPEGTYRLRVDGHYVSDTRDARDEYTVESSAFILHPNTAGNALIEYDESANEFIVQPLYPALVSLEQNTGGERAKLSGALQLIDPRFSVNDRVSMTEAQHALRENGFIDEDTVVISATFTDSSRDITEVSCADLVHDCTIESTNPDAPQTVVRVTLPNDHVPVSLDIVVRDYESNAAIGQWSAD